MVKLLKENLKDLIRICPIEKIKLYDENLTIEIKSDYLHDSLFFFRYHTLYQFEILTCISGVDYPKKKHRFSIVYDILSVRYNSRFKIKVFTTLVFRKKKDP